eukprot:1861357-Rhodomonas_salina.3
MSGMTQGWCALRNQRQSAEFLVQSVLILWVIGIDVGAVSELCGRAGAEDRADRGADRRQDHDL